MCNCNSVTLPRDLIDQIDRMAGEGGREQFVVEAVNERIRQRRLEALEQFAGSLADVDIPGWETPEAAAEWVHNLRHHPDKLVSPASDPDV